MQQAHNFEIGLQDGALALDSLVVSKGAATDAHVQMLLALATDPKAQPLPALADAVHYIALLHGRFPGVIDHAATRIADNAARDWLIRMSDAFATERAYFAKLAVALGPVPSTIDHSNSDSTVLQLRHALEMLAQSDRRGCALGAAATLALDWVNIRTLLDHAALRAGMEPMRTSMPDRADTLSMTRNVEMDELTQRALHFGGRQLLQQHKGLWTLLQKRAELRAEQQ